MSSTRFSCFVAGTDTGVGKTLVSGALLHALGAADLRAAGMKPVAAGAYLQDGIWRNEDADFLAQAGNLALEPDLATPYLFHAPAAPHLAAAQQGVIIEPARIIACYDRIAAQAEAVVVEGVGGFRVPLTKDYDTADLARELGLPVVLVVGMRLGCLSAALLTAEAIAARGLTLAGWVANTVEPDMLFADENVDALRARLPAPLLGRVPKLAEPTAQAAARHLDLATLPGWPAPRQDRPGAA